MRQAALIVAMACVGATAAVQAQNPQASPPPAKIPPPPKAGEVTPKQATNLPGVQFLRTRYKITDQEAMERLALEREVVALSKKLRPDSTFAGITIDHEPVYQIIVSFNDGRDRAELLGSLPANLRRTVKIRTVKRNVASIQAGMDEILAKLRPLPADGFTIAFDERNEKFIISHDSRELASQIRDLIPPTMRDEIQIRNEPTPKRQAAPIGVQPGDYIHGGWTHYENTSGAMGCTFGYAVRMGSTQGILTAGHCEKDNPTRQYWEGSNGHWVQLPKPTFVKNDPNTKYDFQFHETTGYSSGGWVLAWNKNGRPGYNLHHYLNVNAALGYYDQKVGMVMCKAGRVTGFTCGEIIHGYYTFNGAKGFIQYGKADAYSDNLSDPGDSGAPTFMSPDLRDNITAYGIHVAGTVGNGCTLYTACTAVSMPIDYIDDDPRYPVQMIFNNTAY